MIIEPRISETQIVSEYEELLKIIEKLNPKKVLEIGSLMGFSLKHFMKYSADESVVISVDLPVRDFCGPMDYRVKEQEENYAKEWPRWAKEFKSKLYLIKGMSQWSLTLEEVKIICNNELDFLFIDGNHMYDFVKKDFEMYSPLVKKGGVIALHDIAENEEGGVFNFWNEIKTNYKHKEILHSEKKEKGIGVLYV
jgi:predicted O-methyltransferase YrrM